MRKCTKRKKPITKNEGVPAIKNRGYRIQWCDGPGFLPIASLIISEKISAASPLAPVWLTRGRGKGAGGGAIISDSASRAALLGVLFADSD